jgi:hypothetical protein
MLALMLITLAMPDVGVGAQEAARVVDTTIAVDPGIRSTVDAWLGANAPVPFPYWAITYVEARGADTFVSIVALDIPTPETVWHITDSNDPVWMGSLILHEDGSVELYSDGGASEQANAVKLAMPSLAPGGGSAYAFPWQSGGTLMYGPRGVHDAGGGGAYAAGMYAVDFVGGDDMGSGVASNRVYAVYTGTVDYVCEDDTTTLVRTENTETNDYFIYAHLLTNANLVMDHVFSRGALIGSVKYGTFDDSCGYADQTAKHYHLHFGFKFGSGAFRLENCILSASTEKWTCGTQVISTGQFLKGGGGLSGAGDDTGMSVDQPSFWDYVVTGAVSLWDRTVVQNMPTHKAIQYTYVIYSTVKLMLRLARVMVYSNLNLGWFFLIIVFGFSIKIAFGIAEFIVFLFKAWKSLVPIIGA